MHVRITWNSWIAVFLVCDSIHYCQCTAGVLNVVHGSHDVVNAICDHSDIKAVSFVGSDAAGKHIYTRATATGKRVQANTGAKNHAVVMPDADVDRAAQAIVGAAFGAAGQRCMAISAVVVVGELETFEQALAEAASKLKVLALVLSAFYSMLLLYRVLLFTKHYQHMQCHGP